MVTHFYKLRDNRTGLYWSGDYYTLSNFDKKGQSFTSYEKLVKKIFNVKLINRSALFDAFLKHPNLEIVSFEQTVVETNSSKFETYDVLYRTKIYSLIKEKADIYYNDHLDKLLAKVIIEENLDKLKYLVIFDRRSLFKKLDMNLINQTLNDLADVRKYLRDTFKKNSISKTKYKLHEHYFASVYDDDTALIMKLIVNGDIINMSEIKEAAENLMKG